ncbi:MAG TPA: LPS export ABC transporter periplasmic protein LptC [Casimicrobiaceae bacterium]|jgi:lipopolysaccharide export system protein LptC|nr:LPS export ABC transporter periplasmic protein LptC [Casimicrobiaceae bacterium]HXL82539.1 LPS export ABC transporter periplasmic protein LptC [Casimicrobiaceae bacterium]
MNRGRAWLDRLIAWSPVFLLGAFSALTYWLNAQVQPGGAAFDGSGRHDTDLYIEDFKAVSLDPQGHIRQSITARIARHFPDNDTTEFEAPLITFSEPGKPPISITADRGMITGDQQNAYFTGKVKGIREAAAGERDQGRIIVTSEYLHVLPKEDKIETDKPVTISEPRGIINATGMEFDNKAKTFKFKSRVSGQLQPNK